MLDGYFHVFDQILRNYGIPAKFKADNRSVFYYRSSAMKDNSKDVLTQFNYACRQLGVQLESQAKGAVERTNQTFQYRLVNELRLHATSSIEQSNQFLIASFVPKYNRIFPDRLVGFPSVFEISPEIEKINYLLAVLSPRIFDGVLLLSFMGASIKRSTKTIASSVSERGQIASLSKLWTVSYLPPLTTGAARCARSPNMLYLPLNLMSRFLLS